jgi:protoporphyrinogen oxidase
MSPETEKAQIAIIIGAGPAGLTTAYELVKRTKIKPIILECTDRLGGLACTINYKGNRIDIGGHRFFSKSDRVMDWWLDVMPMQKSENESQSISYHRATTSVNAQEDAPDPTQTDRVMLVRNRKSRIFFMRKLFDYPLKLNAQTLGNLGMVRTVKVGISYVWSSFFQIKPERTLAEFFTNRFGKELYLTFFKSYTEKVWGVSCNEISAAWGAQRVKGLSLWKAFLHHVKNLFSSSKDVKQKATETSLIERFLYPKLGPGQMWEIVADEIRNCGGEIIMNTRVSTVDTQDQRLTAIETVDQVTGERTRLTGDYFFSTMPIKDLVNAFTSPVPAPIKQIGNGLVYRDFITVGLLVNRLSISDNGTTQGVSVSDNWIYIQEPDVKLGRLQIFNNWSPYLVSDPSKVWLGLEYFCNETDEMWNWGDSVMSKFAGMELEKIGIIKASDIIDTTVIHMPKTYPGYFGTYDRFDELRSWFDEFDNLFLIGRNGMHKYNNQDHSMLAAMTAVDNIIAGIRLKDNLWSINTEEEYHEEKS